MIPSWVNKYLDIEFKPLGRDRSGCDCWGLFRLVMLEQYGVALGSFLEYNRTDDTEAISGLLSRNRDKHWQEVLKGRERAGDGLLLRFMGEPMHVGVVVGDGRMLHIVAGTNSCVESYTSPKWASRIVGIYRYDE